MAWTPPPSDSADKLSALLSLAASLPAAEAEREPLLNSLAKNLAVYAADDRPLPPEAADLALRLTRRALLDLYSGYALGTFAPAVRLFRPHRLPPAEQLRLQERLKSLSRLPLARAEVFRWASAALRGELIPLLRQQLQRASPLTRRLSGAGLTAMQSFSLSQNDRTPEYEFGLAALRLVAENGSLLSAEQFAALTATLDAWVNDLPSFPEHRLRDLFTLLAPLPLTPAQRSDLRARLLAWRDLQRFPAVRAYARRTDYVRAQTRAWGWRGPLAALTVFVARFFPPPEPPAADEERVRRDLSLRLPTLISGLSVLARQEEESLAPLLDLFADLLRQFLLALQLGGAIECEWALIDLLPAFLAHPAHLPRLAETLENFRFYKFSDTALSDLAARALLLDTASLSALLELRRRSPKHDWVWQVIEHSGGLDSAAEAWLTEALASSPDPETVEAARRLLLRPRLLHADLTDALALRLMRLFQQQGSLPSEWAAALAQSDEALRRLLLRFAESLSASGEETALRGFLRLMSDALYDLPALTPHKLAAACLADPQDPLASGLPLNERLQQSADLLLGRGEERDLLALLRRILPPETPDPVGIERLRQQGDYPALRVAASHPRLIPILLEGWTAPGVGTRAAAPRRLALARALALVFAPEHALPLLRDLFDLACEMYRAWHQSEYLFTELYREAGPLARQVALSLLTLQPLLPEAVPLLGEILHSSESLPEQGFNELNPAFIHTDLLPALAGATVHPQAVPPLLNLLTHPPSSAPHRREVERQVALQALSNLATLSADQQELLWQHGYASPDMLTRALALLALGRQRPLGEKTWQTVRHLLRLSPQARYNQRRAEIARLPDRNAYFHPGDAFLVAGVAAALTAEWLKDADLLPPAQRAELRAALQKAASPLYRGLEAKLSPLPMGEGSRVRALALSLCDAVHCAPDDDPDWLVHPADLAYSILVEFLKTSEVLH